MMATAKTTTFQCHETKQVQTHGGTGYAQNEQDELICYACCALVDVEYMRNHDRITLYLSERDGKYYVGNWPDTLRIGPVPVRNGRHNIAGSRQDTWFDFAGKHWHGVLYGEWTQLLHCRATKG